MIYRTRRFKALNGAKEPYSRVVEKIGIYNKRGKMIDCCVIHTDENNREFYYPSNFKDKFKLFLNKPKDALDCIQNGFGDALTTSSFLGFNSLHVIRYIDREYGEKIREKTLDGWKDTKFAYGIKFSYLNSFSDGRLLMKNNKLMSFDDKEENILVFEDSKSARDYIQKIKKKTKIYFNEYLELPRTEDPEYDFQHTVDPFFDKFEKEIEGGLDSIHWNVFNGMELEQKSGNPAYKLSVVQIVLH